MHDIDCDCVMCFDRYHLHKEKEGGLIIPLIRNTTDNDKIMHLLSLVNDDGFYPRFIDEEE